MERARAKHELARLVMGTIFLVYEYDEKCTAGVGKSESTAKCHSVRMHEY